MGWFRRLFGNGVIFAEVETDSRTGNLKLPYEGNIDNETDALDVVFQCANNEFSDTIKRIRITKITGTHSDVHITSEWYNPKK